MDWALLVSILKQVQLVRLCLYKYILSDYDRNDSFGSENVQGPMLTKTKNIHKKFKIFFFQK